jgi:uncharacterized membrane protein HdeD (DUF308 family)
MWLEFIFGLVNILIGVMNYSHSPRNISLVNVVLGVFLILLGLVFLRAGAPIRKNIKKLQQEKLIRE